MKDHRTLNPESEALSDRLRVLKETLTECLTEGRLHWKWMSKPHWYLLDASKLLRPMLERFGRDGLPCWLEAHNERNVTLYTHYGFVVAEEGRLKQPQDSVTSNEGTSEIHNGRLHSGRTNMSGTTTIVFQFEYQSRPRRSTGRQAWAEMVRRMWS